MTTVSFPGLGIGEFTMDKVALAFTIFGKPVEIRWYGIIITLGIILAILYALMRSKQEGISTDDLLDIGIFAIIFAIVGARIYYVLTYGISNFIVHDAEGKVRAWDSFVNIIAVWNGGIAIYGAIIAGGITVYLVCRHKKIKCTRAFDAIAPAVMIGQILGRWGNFVNGEAHGGIVNSSSPLYFLRMGLLPNEDSLTRMYYYHPTFLYESVWNLIGFLIINALYKKKKFDGQVFLEYITWYGFGRMFIEGLRTDSLYIGVFRVSQLVGFACFVVGGALLVRGLILAKRAECLTQDYEPVYKRFIKQKPVVKTAVAGTAQAESPVQPETTDKADSSEQSEADATEPETAKKTETIAEKPETTESTETIAEKPETTESTETIAEKPETTESMETVAEKPETAESAKTSEPSDPRKPEPTSDSHAYTAPASDNAPADTASADAAAADSTENDKNED